MHPSQKKAVENHLDEMTDVLEVVIMPLLTYLQKHKVINPGELQVFNHEMSNEAKAGVLLRLIKAKDNGWEALISYLNTNNYGRLADKLQNSAEMLHQPINSNVYTTFTNSISDIPNRDFMTDFKRKLATHYKIEYSRVPTVFGRHKPIEKVWVPLQIDDKTETFRRQDSFDHVELLTRLKKPLSPHVALVTGHPGVGKTTLVKKIAYDWAADKVDQFSVVLAVPLRYVSSTPDFLQLAAEYYGKQLNLLPVENAELSNRLHQLGHQLLICLDGLDEYGSWAQSPFKTLFAAPFTRTSEACFQSPPPSLPYQLLITSRPYACEVINRDFFPLRFEISPLDEIHLAEFVQLYCNTEEGADKVSKYLQINSELVIKNPLILTFVCYLADMREEIPTNFTLLYDRFLSHMVKREIEGGKLREKINSVRWKTSKLVKETAEIAFEGCKNGKFEFPQLAEDGLSLIDDSFTCGFLLHKFDFRQEILSIEFPHRSIQEFFAALHCYQLIFTDQKTERNWVMTELFTRDSQFCRFFFGICSFERQFDKMLEWLSPTFADAKIIFFNFGSFLADISSNLSDCNEAKIFGQKLAASLDELEYQIITGRTEMIRADWPNLSSFNKSFQSGLNLYFLDKTNLSWYISHAEKPKWSRLTFVYSVLPANLQGKFEILVWLWDINDFPEMISSLDRLPPVSTLIVQTDDDVDFEVNFHLKYELTTPPAKTSSMTQLRHFTFSFDGRTIPEYNEKFLSQLEANDLIIEEPSSIAEEGNIRWVTVTVSRSSAQHKVVKTLINSAMQMYRSFYTI